MGRAKTTIILSCLCLKNSLAIIEAHSPIYACRDVIKKIKDEDIDIHSNINEISFEALNSGKIVKVQDLFFALASFGETHVRLIASDTQLNIVDAANMIKLPHVLNIKIFASNLQDTKLIDRIKLASKIAIQSKARMTIKNEENQELTGQINIYHHKILIIDLEKTHEQ